jgi:hypothetical protein
VPEFIASGDFLVSARTARRGAGRCRLCLSGDGVIAPPDDDDRRYWLERFSDEELAEIVWFVFGHRPDREHIASERERLFGGVVAGMRGRRRGGDRC